MQHRHNLFRRALIKHQTYLGIKRAERFYHLRQTVTRLGMGGGNDQLAGIIVGKYVGQPADIAGVVQILPPQSAVLARFGHAQQAFTPADKYFNPQFFFQLADMTTHPGLRGKQGIRHFGQVVIAPC